MNVYDEYDELLNKTIDQKRRMAHCDQWVLHSGWHGNTAITLFANTNSQWTPFIHRIDDPLDIQVLDSITQGNLVRPGTSVLGIRLTRPAWNVLKSNSTLSLKQSVKGLSHRSNVSAGTFTLVLDSDVRNVLKHGEKHILRHQNGAKNLLLENEYVGQSSEIILGRSENNPVPIVVPVFHGTSWTLTIVKDDQSRSVDFKALDQLKQLMPNWSDAIWSVLSAIRPELTIAQWQQEHAYLSTGTCEYCDLYPELQEFREAYGIQFTNEEYDPSEHRFRCPALHYRSLETIERWGGNIAHTRL